VEAIVPPAVEAGIRVPAPAPAQDAPAPVPEAAANGLVCSTEIADEF